MPKLDFPSKDIVYAHHLTVPYRPLEAVAEKSVGDGGLDSSLIINGDNLHALKALLARYGGRVNCVYIDPPYNTGNGEWVYSDRVDSPTMRKWLEANKPVDGEDQERHDKWCCMIWPRLQLLRELLAEDGVIFVSIDDNEQANLKLIMDELFGEENFVVTNIWEKKYGRQNDARYFSKNHDFILCYAKNKEKWRPISLPRDEERDAASYKNPDDDPRGRWRSDHVDVRTYMPEYDYPVTIPSGRVVNPPKGRCWSFSRKKYEEMVADNRIWFGTDGNNAPYIKRFLREVKPGIVPQSIVYHREVGSTAEARKEIRAIFGDVGVFETPKPTRLLKYIFKIAAGKDAIVLDSFAGSGATAQAALELNKEDGGSRKFILVECEDYADEVTAERVRRVIRGVPDAKNEALRKGLGGQFTFCVLGEELSEDGVLSGEKLPSFAALAKHLFYNATGASLSDGDLKCGIDCFIGEHDNYRFYLIYEPNKNSCVPPARR